MQSGRSIVGLGPHGETPSSPDRLRLGEAEIARARARGFRVAVAMHTIRSDWARQHTAGAMETFARLGVEVLEVVDCAFGVEAQVHALARLAALRPDAILSLPAANAAVAEAHRAVTAAGIRLILIDNAPGSLIPGRDYACLVSADSSGLGQTAARLLAQGVPEGGVVAVLSYRFEFFVAAERELAFRKWMAAERPDIRLVTARFKAIGEVPAAVEGCLRSEPALAGLFAVWDTPALEALATLRAHGRTLPITTIDLGLDVANALAAGDCLIGIAAQRPFEQGALVATATVAALLGLRLPAWIVVPALEVRRDNVGAAYAEVWRAPAPPSLTPTRASTG